MKRTLYILCFGIFGFAFIFLVQIVNGFFGFFSGPSYQSPGTDIEHELKLYIFLGGSLFFVVWAWIGNVSSQNWRRGAAMAAGVIFATALCFALPNLLGGSYAKLFEKVGEGASVITWALIAWASISALLAGFFGFIVGRVWKVRTAVISSPS
jgi:hypothetical protein